MCKVKYGEKDLQLLRDAIEDLYYFEFVIGEFFIAMRFIKLNTLHYKLFACLVILYSFLGPSAELFQINFLDLGEARQFVGPTADNLSSLEKSYHTAKKLSCGFGHFIALIKSKIILQWQFLYIYL